MALMENNSLHEASGIVSSVGLYDDGWMGREAMLSFASDLPLILHFYLPMCSNAKQSKQIWLYGSDTKSVIAVERGILTASAPFASINGRVSVQIYCDEIEPSSESDQRELGLLFVSVSGEDGITFKQTQVITDISVERKHSDSFDDDPLSVAVDTDAVSASLDPFEADAIRLLFDREFYLSGFGQDQAPIDPISHFLSSGWLEGREPAPWFSSHHYKAMHPDVAAVGMNPFLHYCLAGKTEGRKLARLGHDSQGDAYRAHAFAVEAGPLFEEFDPFIGIGRRKRAKVLAYYLPQFHAVEVNDVNWGKGFTEWRNIPRATPRFEGHIQPKIPRDLGYYDLSTGETMRRQIEMAKASGIHGFCFYHYWFDGKRVMEKPIEHLLGDPSLEMPFVLMWANENWTRTWDGHEGEVLLRQSYRKEDDAAFVADLARHFSDKRYIRIDGRPLFFIYRPNQIPNSNETIQRWRDLLHLQHGLEPLIFMAQGFGDLDPRVFGLDGAIEFPPHKLCQGLPGIAGSLNMLDPNYAGMIFSYDAMVERAITEAPPEFPLIRTVTPQWDNEARRPGRGMVVHGSTPQKFEDWMNRSVAFSLAHPTHGESFVCVNAWNEWAEGAVLEPDVHFGAAYLNSVARAVYGIPSRRTSEPSKVLIIGHDAHRNGAQMLAINIGRTLTRVFGVEVAYLLCGDGPLMTEYMAIGKTHVVSPTDAGLPQILRELAAGGYNKAIANTTVSGTITPYLKSAGFSVTSLVHELKRLIEASQLVDAAKSLAKHADRVIFPSEVVRSSFVDVSGPINGKVEILPQGLYKRNLIGLPIDKASLRSELGLPEQAKIVINVGYGDLRKGVDRFISTAISLCRQRDDVYFIWVGAPAGEVLDWHMPDIERAGLTDRIRVTGYEPNVERWYAGADLFFLTSREDPFPSVVMEALALGLPIVGYKGAGGCDQIIDNMGRLVSPDLPLHAEGAICELLDLPEATRNADCSVRRKLIEDEYRFTDYCFNLLQRLTPNLPKLSVVVPNYNYEKYIGDRLRTIFHQSFPVFETIVLDDASPDCSVAEIKRVVEECGRDIDLIVNSANSGSPFPQWRKGVELAKGDYVWIGEADDLAAPSFVSRLIEQMQLAGSVLGFVDSRQVDENDDPLGDSYKPYINQIEPGAFDKSFDMDGRDFLARYLAVKNVILNVSGVIFHRETLLDAFDAVGEELFTYSVAGDWRLYAEICAREGCRVSYMADTLNTHRRHRVSVTHALKVDKHLAEIARMHDIVRGHVKLTAKQIARQAVNYDECRRHLMGEG